MFKSILVALKPSANQDYVIGNAVALAKRISGELTACTVIDDDQISPPESTPIGGGAFKKERDAERLIAARAAADQVMHACQSMAAAAGVTCRVEQLDGDVVDLLMHHLHEHDLLVVGDAASDDTGDESLLGRIVKNAARPVIVFPKQPAVGESVLVAYDGSIQAARAMASFAYSGLGRDRTIHVIACDANSQRADELSEIACRFLRRYDLSVEPHVKSLTDSPAAVLAKSTTEYAAGMLVMGAFGQSAVRELFFGSTTRTILRNLPTPVFLDR
jgi:nucleotide-binding universal stress UspA family protein